MGLPPSIVNLLYIIQQCRVGTNGSISCLERWSVFALPYSRKEYHGICTTYPAMLLENEPKNGLKTKNCTAMSCSLPMPGAYSPRTVDHKSIEVKRCAREKQEEEL